MKWLQIWNGHCKRTVMSYGKSPAIGTFQGRVEVCCNNGKPVGHWFSGKGPVWRQRIHGLENAGVDPAASHMQSERSTIWANSPQLMHTREVVTSRLRFGTSLLKLFTHLHTAEFKNVELKSSRIELWVLKGFNETLRKKATAAWEQKVNALQKVRASHVSNQDSITVKKTQHHFVMEWLWAFNLQPKWNGSKLAQQKRRLWRMRALIPLPLTC